MTLFIKPNRVIIIFFLFILFFTCGCVTSNDTRSLTQRIRERVMSQPAGNAEDSDIKLIYAALKKKQYDTAINQCEKIRKVHPDDVNVYLLEGWAYRRKGEYAFSIDWFSRIINSDKTKGYVYYLRAQSYLWSKKPEKALDDITKALDNRQTPVQVVNFSKNLGIKDITIEMVKGFLFNIKAQAYSQLGEVDAAIGSINRSIEYYSTYGPSYEVRGQIYFKQKKYSQAYKDFQKTVEIIPKSIFAWNIMGMINFFRGNYNEAVAQYQKANQLNPKDVNVLLNMSLAYWLQGNRVKAFEAMGKALRGKPDSDIFYHSAYLYHLNGNKDKALANFKKAHDLNPLILKIRQAVINRVPARSPTRKFYQDQFRTAKIYIETGRTPMAAANENRQPTLDIFSVTLEPDPVPVNQAFDFRVRFKVDIQGSADNKIAIVFYFKVIRNNKTLFTSKFYPIKVTNGKINTRTQHMTPVPAKGVYTMKAFVKYKKLLAEKSIKLTIK